jgi:hypothetical protein
MTSSSNTINYTDFVASDLKFTKLEENDRSNGQLVGYPRYNKNNVEIPLEIQLPWIKLFTYGVPQLNQFYKTDNDRSQLRLPLDLRIPEVAAFAEKLKQIDSIMSSPEMMETLLGNKKAKKYKYQPLYREGTVQEEDSDDDDKDNTKKKSNAIRPPYFKLKLKLSYPDKKVESKVFESDESKTNGKRTRTKVETNTIDEFASFIRYQALVRPVMKPFKLWAHPVSKKDPEFGIACRLERIEVDKASISGSYKSVYNSENFIDSDDDELPKISNMKVNDSDSSDDEKVIKLVTKENIIEVDSDSDSDPEQKVTKTQTPIADIDSDDSDEEIVVAKQVKKKEKKTTTTKSSKR